MIVGLTGGIGSGKSTVASVFSALGVPVYEADAHSKQIIDTDRELQARLVEVLGTEVMKEGRIDRPKMASLIFENKKLLETVNSLIHPAVAKHFADWKSEQSYPYVIKEAAILFESGSYRQCNRIVVVTAPKEMRVDRVMMRSGMSREEVLARMNNQWPEEQKVEKANYIVKNDFSQSVIKQVIHIHEDIIRQSNTGS